MVKKQISLNVCVKKKIKTNIHSFSSSVLNLHLTLTQIQVWHEFISPMRCCWRNKAKGCVLQISRRVTLWNVIVQPWVQSRLSGETDMQTNLVRNVNEGSFRAIYTPSRPFLFLSWWKRQWRTDCEYSSEGVSRSVWNFNLRSSCKTECVTECVRPWPENGGMLPLGWE